MIDNRVVPTIDRMCPHRLVASCEFIIMELIWARMMLMTWNDG